MSNEIEEAIHKLNLTQTYSLNSCMGMWSKLQREYGRFLQARHDRHDASDHLVNFSVTAWHMSDWCFELYFKENASLQGRHSIYSLSDMHNYVRSVFPEVSYLDVLANAAKHGGRADQRPFRPQMKTGFDPGDTRIGSWGRLADVHSFEAPHGWDAVIDTEEGRLLTQSIFRKALYVWLDLFDRFGISDAEGHVTMECGTTPWPSK